MSDKKSTTLTPKAQHPERTQKFVSVIAEALEAFEDNIGSLEENIQASAYETFINSYKDALSHIWRPAAATDMKLILKTITDKQLASLMEMAKRLEPQPPTAKVSQEKRKIPDLEILTSMLKDRCPNQEVPNIDICKQISDVFFKLAEAHKAYGEAAQGLAELASSVTPEQYTMLLAASAMPMIQVVVPGQLIRPLSLPQIHQTETSTAIGHAELIKHMKSQILPDPYSSDLSEENENSATRVLAAAVFLKIEKVYFDDITSRMDAARLFHCKVSQLTKAITGIEYKSGPHHYVPKKHQKTTTTKRKEEPDPEPEPSATKKQKQSSTPSVDKDEPTPSPDTLQMDSSTVSYPKASNSFVPYNSHTVLYNIYAMLHFIFKYVLHYIRLQDRHTVFLFYIYSLINLKQNP